MQLVKTCAATERLAQAGVPYISIMSDPTTGGVFASFAALGDVNIAEPNALIGFAGARVQAGTTGDQVPEGFQRAEFLFQHGFVDLIVPRAEMRAALARLLGYLQPRTSRTHPVEPVRATRSRDRGSRAAGNGSDGVLDAEAVRG
jgi:acetyl-CoA carboxylase carboxyl transferase subunit beta